MRALIEQSTRFLEKGLQKKQEGDLKGARFYFLKAAELLYKVAAASPVPLQEVRLKQADRLMSLADSLKLEVERQGGRREEKASLASSGETTGWVLTERPRVKLSDVAGLEEAKEQIKLRLIYPFTHPELAERYGIKKRGGILLYGPPGTGKTLLARAVAGEIDAPFFHVRPADIMSKWVGEAEKNIARLFEEARKYEKAVIFIDEIDALASKRSRANSSTVARRVISQILVELEGLSSAESQGALLFLGATNEPWALDEAILRPGRFDDKIYVPLPDFAARMQILKQNLEGKPLSPSLSLERVASALEGYSGADIRRICEKTAERLFLLSLKEGKEHEITTEDLLDTLGEFERSVSKELLAKYERFRADG